MKQGIVYQLPIGIEIPEKPSANVILEVGSYEALKEIRNEYNKFRRSESQPPLTVSDLANACIVAVLEAGLPFHLLERSEELSNFVESELTSRVASEGLIGIS